MGEVPTAYSIGKELAKNVKTQKDLSDITGQLMKGVLETALNAEMDEYLSVNALVLGLKCI